MDIKKRTFIVCLCFILLFLISCSQTSIHSSKKVSSNDSTTISHPKKNPELKGQDVSDITKLATPDEIVYLHNGVKTTFTKEDVRFQGFIIVNNKRQTNKLGACECMIDKSFQGDYLIYNYKNNYVPVYFKLVPSPDEGFENNVFNYYGSTPIPSNEINDPTKTEIYGHLAPANQLLAYLNSKLQN
jgi:hypothetical protein